MIACGARGACSKSLAWLEAASIWLAGRLSAVQVGEVEPQKIPGASHELR